MSGKMGIHHRCGNKKSNKRSKWRAYIHGEGWEVQSGVRLSVVDGEEGHYDSRVCLGPSTFQSSMSLDECNVQYR